MEGEGEGVGDGAVCDLAFVGVESLGEDRVTSKGLRQAEIGNLFDEGEGNVAEGLGRGPGHGAGDVGYTVVDNAVYQEGWIGVGCRLTGLNATALVDGDVYYDGAGRHAADHVPGHDLRGLSPGYQDSADYQVGIRHGPGGGVLFQRQR